MAEGLLSKHKVQGGVSAITANRYDGGTQTVEAEVLQVQGYLNKSLLLDSVLKRMLLMF